MLSPAELFTLLRVLLGALFVAHGVYHLFGWFGGHGLHAYSYDLAATGMRRARAWARVSNIIALGAGALLVLGLVTPFAAAALVMTRVVTIARLHAHRGFWLARGGSEYQIVLIVIAVLVALVGPGSLALDNLIVYPWTYKMSLVASILVGTIGTVAAITATNPRGRKLPTFRQTT